MANDKEFKLTKSSVGKLNSVTVEDKDKQLAKDIMSFNLKLFQMYNTKPETPEELADRFVTYFQMCLNEGRIPTIERFSSCFQL